MTFKDCVNNDVRDVFLNTDAFGEEISLACEGECTTMRAVVDEAGIDYGHADTPALPLRQRVIYAATVDIPAACVSGASIIFNGQSWAVDRRVEEMGVTELHISRAAD